MRVVSWNMAYWKFASYKSVANRRRQWSYLMALAPDLALLQECRPGDLCHLLPGWPNEEYEVLGEIPDGWIACSAILARKSLQPRFVHWSDSEGLAESSGRWLAFFAGYVARAQVTVPGLGQVRVASVHAVAKEVDDDAVATPDDHAEFGRGTEAKAWHNDLAAGALRDWAADRFVVGGDWNTARQFDVQYPAWGNSSRQFFDRMAEWKWAETLRRDYPEEIGTYLDPACYPYELDHLFTDRGLHDRLTRCTVIHEAPLAEMSDHAPIVADFAIEAG